MYLRKEPKYREHVSDPAGVTNVLNTNCARGSALRGGEDITEHLTNEIHIHHELLCEGGEREGGREGGREGEREGGREGVRRGRGEK